MESVAKIDVAVLGIGEMGGTHARAAKSSPYVGTVYGYEPDAERCRQRAAELGIVPATLEEILANPAIRFVSVASANEFHAELTIAALRAGKAVLCEKPMGMNFEEAQRIIEVKNETGGFLQIGFELHYSRMYGTVKQWIEAGLIGDVANIQCRYYCCEFHRKDSWRSNSKGIFLIGEKLSHYLDLQRWLFAPQQTLESVYAVRAPKVVPYFRHDDDNHTIVTKFSKGGLATLNFIMNIAETYHGAEGEDPIVKQCDDGHMLQFHIVGSKGAIETDVFRRRIRRFEFTQVADGMESKIVETITFPKEEDLIYFHNTAGQNHRVIEMVAKGMQPEVPAEDALASMKYCFAAEESERTGKIIYMT